MTSDPRAALREKVADIILDSTEPTFERIADAAIAVVLEEAARELEGWGDIYGRNAAAAVRALMGKD